MKNDWKQANQLYGHEDNTPKKEAIMFSCEQLRLHILEVSLHYLVN